MILFARYFPPKQARQKNNPAFIGRIIFLLHRHLNYRRIHALVGADDEQPHGV